MRKESLHKLCHQLRWQFFTFISLSCSSNIWNSYIYCFSNLFFLYRCHFNKHRGIACILIATTAINSLRVISRWGTDLFPLETQRGPSGRRKKWEGKEWKGRKGKGTKIEKERLSFSPNSLLPPLLSFFAAYRLGPVSDNQFLVCYTAPRVMVNCVL